MHDPVTDVDDNRAMAGQEGQERPVRAAGDEVSEELFVRDGAAARYAAAHLIALPNHPEANRRYTRAFNLRRGVATCGKV
jgi:hypothetical protein